MDDIFVPLRNLFEKAIGYLHELNFDEDIIDSMLTEWNDVFDNLNPDGRVGYYK